VGYSIGMSKRSIPVKAHQRVIRDFYAAGDFAEDPMRLFPDAAPADPDLSTSEVRPILLSTATGMILKYEYLGKMTGGMKLAFGHFFGKHLGGALVFGESGSPVAFSKMFPGLHILTLQRGVNLWWTPPNSASFFISRVCSLIKDMKNSWYDPEHKNSWDGITATADEEAGEIGTIYQALNWIYLGPVSADNRGFVLDGKSVHPKTMYDKCKTSSIPKLKEIYGDRLIVTSRSRKHRYVFLFKKRKSLKSLPYPKRPKSQGDSSANHAEELGSIPGGRSNNRETNGGR